MKEKFEDELLYFLDSINSRLGELVEQKRGKRKLAAKARKDDYTEEFTIFWNTYPRKAKKPDAARAYHRAVDRINEHGHHTTNGLDTPHELLVIRALQYAQAWPPSRMRESDGDFRMHPSTWLNQDMFLTPESYQDAKSKESTGPKWEPLQN
jgi:hypothetical protein